MSIGLIISLAGLAVAGFSSLLGMWLERDPDKPKKIAFALSILILLATGVGMVQAMIDEAEQNKMQEDLARMLATLDKIASSSDVAIPELDNLVKSELAAQSRSNPDVVKKMAQRVADDGGDPNAVLGAYMSASEVQELGRKGGLKVKPPAVAVMSVGKSAEKPRDRPRPTLADVASGKASLPGATPAPKPVEPPPEASAPPTVAAAPPTAAPAPPPMVAAVRKAPAAMPAKLPAPAMKAALPTSPKAAVAAFKPAAAAADPGAAAAAAKAKAAADAQAKADAAKAAAEGAKAKAAADAKAKADEAKKKAEAAKKKALEDAKKKIPGGFGF